jgi:hypothetical protein
VVQAWAVTVHKAQGLTLERVIFNPGNKEHETGSFFTALTRVREVSHIMFDPPPDERRVTVEIGKKPAMHLRKVHEHVLRIRARATARALIHLNPPPPALAEPPPPPAKFDHCKTSSTPDANLTSRGGRQLEISTVLGKRNVEGSALVEPPTMTKLEPSADLMLSETKCVQRMCQTKLPFGPVVSADSCSADSCSMAQQMDENSRYQSLRAATNEPHEHMQHHTAEDVPEDMYEYMEAEEAYHQAEYEEMLKMGLPDDWC